MNHHRFMSIAISKAKTGIKKGQTPFGACIIKNGKVISVSHNNVWKNTDIISHAEINAIRQACKKLKTIDLSGCVIYSTCEPCPMCFSACHWAKISKIFYGASIKHAKNSGFNELAISNAKMKKHGKSKIKIQEGLLKKDCIELLKLWAMNKNKKTY